MNIALFLWAMLAGGLLGFFAGLLAARPGPTIVMGLDRATFDDVDDLRSESKAECDHPFTVECDQDGRYCASCGITLVEPKKKREFENSFIVWGKPGQGNIH